MKKSKYNYIIHKNNNYLIFNALQNSCAVLTKEEFKNFKKGKYSSLPNIEDLGFICEKDTNEEDIVLFTSRYVFEHDNTFFYRVYTTMACNARCPYCYEKGLKPEHMTYETADKLINYIVENAKQDMHIVIEWFGGEPLVNAKIIDYICDKLEPLLKEKNAYFTSTMVSNGLLFNSKDIDKYINKWKLKKVQITLDGTKEVYEKIKGFVEKDAFEKVLSNIDFLSANGIKVNIRLNYNKKDFSDILELIKFLGTKYKDNKYVFVYARRIMTDEQDNSFKASAKTDIIIFKALIEAGLLKKSSLLKTIPRRTNMCLAHMLNAYLVSPTGQFGKCSQALFSSPSLGNLDEGINDKHLVKWCTPRLDNKCLKCKLLPICNGGCLYEKFKRKNYCYYSEKVLYFKLKTFLDDYISKQEQ